VKSQISTCHAAEEVTDQNPPSVTVRLSKHKIFQELETMIDRAMEVMNQHQISGIGRYISYGPEQNV
jgi:hypothetical protein